MELTKLEALSVRLVMVLTAIMGPCLASGKAADRTGTMAAKVPAAAVRSEATRIRPKAQWKLGLQGVRFADIDRNESAQTATLDLGSKLQMRLLPVVDFQAEGSVSVATGQAQTRFGDHVPQSGILLKEALVSVRPLESLTLSAGAVDQGHLDSPLLVSSRAFPGAVERVRIGDKRYSVEVRAQQTVPTSVTMTTKTGLGEATPTFFSESLLLKARFSETVEVRANATHFAFRGLPSQVAVDSQIHGNTVLELGPNTSRFAYEFEGWTAGGMARLILTPGFALSGGTQLLQNTRAPEGFRNGQTIFGETEIALPGEITLKPRGEVFFAESDASPAFYNSAEYGHNNRKGFAADLDIAFRKEKFRVGGRYVDANLIDSDLHQGRQRFWMLRFETTYANF